MLFLCVFCWFLLKLVKSRITALSVVMTYSNSTYSHSDLDWDKIFSLWKGLYRKSIPFLFGMTIVNQFFKCWGFINLQRFPLLWGIPTRAICLHYIIFTIYPVPHEICCMYLHKAIYSNPILVALFRIAIPYIPFNKFVSIYWNFLS